MPNENRKEFVERSDATDTSEQRLASICLLQALGTDEQKVESLENRIDQLAYNKTFIGYANLVCESPFIEDDHGNGAVAIRDIAKGNIEKIIPDINVVYKNMKTIARVMFAGIFGVVVSLVLILWDFAPGINTRFVLSLAMFLSILLTVVSALSLYHLSFVARKYHELIMSCSIEHTVAVTSKYEELKKSVNSLLSSPHVVFESIHASHGADFFNDVHQNLKEHFSKH